jgi:ATP-dependent Lhr-like helicase
MVEGNSILVFSWRGDWINDALALLLTAKGLSTSNEGVSPRVSSGNESKLEAILEEIAAAPTIQIEDLNLKPEHITQEKSDWAFPIPLRITSFASSALDLSGAHDTVKELLSRHAGT